MPYVNVKILKDGVTTEEKRKLVEDITRSLVVRLSKKPEHIHIVIDEVATDNWGYAGELTTEFLARAAKAIKSQRSPRRRRGREQASAGNE